MLAAALVLACLPMNKFDFSQMHMGVVIRLTLFAPSQTKAKEAASAAFSRFRTLDEAASDYIQTSELSNINKASGKNAVPCSQDLISILESSKRFAVLSDGIFDPTLGSLTQLWRKARREGKLPSSEELKLAQESSGFRALEIGEGSVKLTKPNVKLDLGGIAKGYACDEAMQALSAHGVQSAMVEAGGDTVVSGPPPGELGWKVRYPNGKIETLTYSAISTSGDTEQFLKIEGKTYSHVLDPRTGLGVTKRIQATAIGKWAGHTDPLATIACIEPEVAKRIAEKLGIRLELTIAQD